MEYRVSYSGADTDTFVYFPEAPEFIEPLESLHTLSVSVHEAKAPVRALGHRGVRGFTKSVRTIAGSMILTVIDDNPLYTLLRQWQKGLEAQKVFADAWSVDRELMGVGRAADAYDLTNRLATLIPPFNLITQYVSEKADSRLTGFDASTEVALGLNRYTAPVSGAAMMIVGIEIIDVGLVSSANDMVTEVSLSFVARDYKPLARITSPHFKEALDVSQNNIEGQTTVIEEVNPVPFAERLQEPQRRGESMQSYLARRTLY